MMINQNDFEKVCKYVIAYINDNVIKVLNYNTTLNDFDFTDNLHFMSIENKYCIVYNDSFNNDDMYRIIIINHDSECALLYQYIDSENGDCVDCVEYNIPYNINVAWLINTLLTNLVSFIEYTKTNQYMMTDFTSNYDCN